MKVREYGRVGGVSGDILKDEYVCIEGRYV